MDKKSQRPRPYQTQNRDQGPNHSKPKNKKKKKFNARKMIFGIVIAGILGVICAVGLYIAIMLNGARLLEANSDKFDMAQATKIYDRDGQEVTMLYDQNREVVDETEIPDLLKKAFVATEDRRFYTHSGVDLWSIGRALVKDVVARSAVEGGSTITQQLAKNILYQNPDKTLFRKATEASMAMALEKERSKDQILTNYLNRIYFAHGAYGIKAASKLYFGKSDLNDLKLEEIATLAALAKAPNTYSPIKNPEKSKQRRAVVLQLMKEEGYITPEQQQAAKEAELVLSQDKSKREFMTYIDYVVNEAETVYGIKEEELISGGFSVYTTMNKNAQTVMEQAYANDKLFQKDAKDGTKIQSSMVILDNEDGGVVAIIGGRDYKTKDYNRATSPLQPGSAFKPIAVYAEALENKGYNPYSMLSDEKQCFGKYCPNNYNNQYEGQVTMLDAIKKSKNIAAVSVLNDIGITNGMKMSEKLGMPLDPTNDRNLSIALGGLTNGVSPVQMASAYSVFASGGLQHTTHSIIKIVDSKGTTVKEFKTKPKQVLKASTAYYLTKMMQSVVEPGGTGTRAKMDRPVAGKTGSTGLTQQGYTKFDSNVWFVGYTPQWTAAVWEGFDKIDLKNGHYVTVGSGNTAAIFKEVMSKAMKDMKKLDFNRPKGVEELKEPPKGITDLAVNYTLETRSVDLTWSAVPQSTSYMVYRKSFSEDDFTLIGTVESPAFNDIAITPGESYLYYVIPVQGDVQGDKSNVVEVKIPGDGLEGTPPPDVGPTDPTPPDENGESPETSTPPDGGDHGHPNPTPNPNGGNGGGNGKNPNGGQGGGNGKNPVVPPAVKGEEDHAGTDGVG